MAENENKVPVGSNNAGNVIGWLEKLLRLKKDYGLGNILSAVMLLFITVTVGVVAFKPDIIIEEVQRIQTEQHQRAVDTRIKNDPEIRNAVSDLRTDLNADRVFVVEAHNGGTNLTNLPFLYVDMTYESVRPNELFLEDEYKNVRLQRYSFCTHLYETAYWYGSVDDLSQIDPVFSYRLKGDGVSYIGILTLYGEYTIIGAVGVEYTSSTPADQTTIRIAMHKYANKLAILLNNEASNKKKK